MDMEQFDAMTRRLSGAGSSRRQTLRMLGGALVGSVLGAVTARLGAAEEIEAKSKAHHGKATHRQHSVKDQSHSASQPAARSQAHPKSGGVQSERKGKGHHKPPPLPPGCKHCNACQMCKRGQCVPDSSQERVRCEGSGAACGYCQDGVCTASEQSPCDDGVCPKKGQCCPGERSCSDPEAPLGFYCIDKNACCLDTERQCASGACITRKACCPEQKRCNASLCVGKDECCPGETPCGGGRCAPEGTCCDGKPRCGDNCCGANETCLEDPGGPPWIWRCCPNALNVNGHCCDGTQTVCGPAPGRPAYEQYCCAEGSVCCEGKTCCPVDGGVCCHGSGTCLPANLGPWTECGKVCCNADYYKCCGDSGCCQKEAVCCGDPPRCCPHGYHCCGSQCCRD